MKRPFFSVIICTYNRAGFLARAINSVYNQTFKNFELVVIDDGSIDSTKELLKNFKDVRYVAQNHQGVSAARNRGLGEARGEYIAFLDSDDEFLPDHLRHRYELLQLKPYDLLYNGLEVIGNPLVADKDNPEKLIPVVDCACAGTFVIKKQHALKFGGFRLHNDFSADAEYLEDAGTHGFLILKVDKPTYRYYRTGHDSVSN